ncbi:MAG: hypothetical protein CMO29_08585 [Tistrella sp.]|nr:hypothetical protein [Tistrella sp.]
MPRMLKPGELPDHLPRGGLVWVQGCSAWSSVVETEIAMAADRLSGTTFTGIFVPGLNPASRLLGGGRRLHGFFATPEMEAAGPAADMLPLCYADLSDHLQGLTIDAACFMVAPPDSRGICSFGPVCDFLPDLWQRIPVRIGVINPCLPRTRGTAGIPLSDFSGLIEDDRDLPAVGSGSDDATRAIAARLAGLVPDGATLQIGLGRTPEGALAGLHGHRGLAIHSGLIGDAVVDLLEAGALRPGMSVTTGVAIGTRRLYDLAGDPVFSFRPVSYTHAPRVLAGIEGLVTVNAVNEIDLFGQGYAEMRGGGFVSGPGGATDFARGAKWAGGLRVVVLPAAASGGRVSRIVPPGAGQGPVSLGRFDIDVVVTDHGLADLRGLTHDRRAEALIAAAAPAFRAALAKGWDDWRRGGRPGGASLG